jgi:hypothetical protein
MALPSRAAILRVWRVSSGGKRLPFGKVAQGFVSFLSIFSK